MSHDFLRAIFSRGAFARTDSIIVSVGGVSSNSATLTYDVMHFDATGNLLVNAAISASAAASTISALLAGTVSSLNYAQARTTDPPAAADGVNTPIISDSLGKQVVLPGAVNDLHLDGQVAIAGVLAQTLIPAVAAGRRIAMQSILVTSSASQTVQVIISGGPNSRTFGFCPTGIGGFSYNAGGAALYITSASTALSVAGSVTATFNVFVSGYSLSN